MNKLYIIAGNGSQAHNYAKRLNLVNWSYVPEIFRLYGLRKPKVTFVGSYRERNDYEAISHHLQLIEADILIESDIVCSEFV